MTETWHNWCRMCGKTDSTDSDIIFKVDSLKDKLKIVNECFMISLLPFETVSSLCGECCNFVGKLKGFKYRCLKADKMFKELMLREVPEIDLQAIRWKFGVDKHAIPMQDSSNDSPDVQNKDEEAFSDSSLDSQDDQDDEMVLEETIPTVNIPEYKIKEIPPKKKLFVVSHNKEKMYVPITYHGDLPKYDDFIKCACQELKLNNITIYDQDERELTPNTFSSVFTTNKPPFVIVKTGMSFRTRFPEASNEGNTEEFYKQVVPPKMSKVYQRKPGSTRKLWDEANMIEAVKKVRSKEMSLRKAELHYNVPHGTLHRRVRSTDITPSFSLGPPGCLGRDNERKLVEYLKKSSEKGFPLDRTRARHLAYQFAEKLKIKHKFNKNTKMAGYLWLNSFLRRNPDLSIRKAGGLSTARAKGLPRKED